MDRTHTQIDKEKLMDFDDFDDLDKEYSAVIYVKPDKMQVVVKFFGFNNLQEADVFAKYIAIDLNIQQLIPANRTLN